MYLILLSVVGRINVFHVLWGETIDEDDRVVNRRVILQATAAVATGAVGVFIYDLVVADDWGWFSWIAALIAAGYLVSLARNKRQSSREST